VAPLKILIAPDKFKGTLTAQDAASAIARGWSAVRPFDLIDLLPITDGGDGFGEVMSRQIGAKVQRVLTVDAAHRSLETHWWWEPKTKTAIIESANVIGLAMLPPGKYRPFELDTFGLGMVIRAASAKGAWKCFIGVGGSATNDGGFGLASALDWKFLDHQGVVIEKWTGLSRLFEIRAPKRSRWFEELIVGVDVQNPLLGLRGATKIYGPQKGLRSGEIECAEKCLKTLANVLQKDFGKNSPTSGDGAAGGLGFGLRVFLGAKLKSGFDLFARTTALRRHLESADLVITGEGKLDESSLMGKGVGEIAKYCHQRRIPCFALAGAVTGRGAVFRDFAVVHALTEVTAIAKAKSQPAFWLERLTRKIAMTYS
jgi:glycerate kinase